MDNVPPPYTPPGPLPGRPNQPLPPQRDWFTRNLLWFVPTGCVGLLAIGALVALGISSLVAKIKSSDPYKDGVMRAKMSQQVISALGNPVRESSSVNGGVYVKGGDGWASLNVPLSGPKGRGRLYIGGLRSHGVWDYRFMRVHVEGTDKDINLLDTSP